MRIATFSPHLSRSAGGLYYSVSGLSKAIAAQGHEVAVFGGADAHYEEDKANWGSLDVHAYSMPLGGYAFHPGIFRDIVAFKPDLLHIQGIWSAASLYGRLATMKDIPVMVSPRGMLDPWILARRPLVKKVHAALFERPMLRHASIHALNRSEQRSIAQFMPEVADKIFVVPNGIRAADIPVTDIAREGALFLSRLHPKKQTLELIDAWTSVPALSRHHLTIAGWGDSAYENIVRGKAAEANNVSFVGSLYGEEKAAALSSAKFFILPSLSEGLPMAVLEALQHGAVPIITDQCNLPELFENDVAIRMETDFSDFAEIAKAAFAMDESNFAARSLNARKISERYLWDSVALHMARHYQNMLLARSSPGKV